MKITMEHYGNKFTAETDNDDLNIEDTMRLIKGLLHCLEFNNDSINEYILEEK